MMSVDLDGHPSGFDQTIVVKPQGRYVAAIVIIFVLGFILPWSSMIREESLHAIWHVEPALLVFASIGGVVAYWRWGRRNIIRATAEAVIMQLCLGRVSVKPRLIIDRQQLTDVVLRVNEIPTKGLPYIHRAVYFMAGTKELGHTLPLDEETARKLYDVLLLWVFDIKSG